MNNGKSLGADSQPENPGQIEDLQDHPLVEVLELYVTNEMGPRRKKKVYQHLEICTECKTQVARIRETRRRFRELLRVALAVR